MALIIYKKVYGSIILYLDFTLTSGYRKLKINANFALASRPA